MAGHLPAYHNVKPSDLAKMCISDGQARLIARSGMKLVPTYPVARFRYKSLEEKGDPGLVGRAQVYSVQAANLSALHRAGATLLTGTDVSTPIADEVKQWVEVGGLPAPAALQAALATGRLMFPDRRIGCFDAGCEADFLVLSADPSRDLDALSAIVRRVKGGVELQAPAAEQ